MNPDESEAFIQLVHDFFGVDSFYVKIKTSNSNDIFFNVYNKLIINEFQNEFSDGEPYEVCLNVTLSYRKKEIYIDYLNQCGIKHGGKLFLEKIKEFALLYGFHTISLDDASELYIYFITDNEIQDEVAISLRSFKLLKDGTTWYGKYGYQNEYYLQHRSEIIEYIHQPLQKLLKNHIKKLKETQQCIQKLVRFESNHFYQIPKYINTREFQYNYFRKQEEMYSELFHYFKKYIVETMEMIQLDDNAIESITLSELMNQIQTYLNTKCTHNQCTIDLLENVNKIKKMIKEFYQLFLFDLDLIESKIEHWILHV